MVRRLDDYFMHAVNGAPGCLRPTVGRNSNRFVIGKLLDYGIAVGADSCLPRRSQVGRPLPHCRRCQVLVTRTKRTGWRLAVMQITRTASPPRGDVHLAARKPVMVQGRWAGIFRGRKIGHREDSNQESGVMPPGAGGLLNAETSLRTLLLPRHQSKKGFEAMSGSEVFSETFRFSREPFKPKPNTHLVFWKPPALWRQHHAYSR